jgi:enterochelin esterase-like enzyme
LLHGSGGNENDWNEGISLIDSLIKGSLIDPLIAISPSTGTSWWVNGKENYETAFFNDLKPYIEMNFKIDKLRSSTFIAGFSMGGYGVLRYALTHPNEFSNAIILSPALYNILPPKGSSAIESGSFGKPFNQDLWNEKNYPSLISSYALKNNPVNLFIVAGDDDWNHPEGVEYNIDWQVNLLYSIYNKQLNFPAELRIFDGGHDWELWKKGLKEALLFIFNK